MVVSVCFFYIFIIKNKMNRKLRKIIREEVNRKPLGGVKSRLTLNEQKMIHTLNEEVSVLNENEVVSWLKARLTPMIKSKTLTAAFIIGLMSNPMVASAAKNLPNDIKKELSTIVKSETNNKLKDSVSMGDKKPELTIDLTKNFKSGSYRLDGSVDSQIKRLVDFVNTKGEDMVNYTIVVTASESQVPNQKEFKEIGSLAKKRGEVVSDLVQSQVGIKPEVRELIGDVEFNAKNGDNKDDSKYTKDQFVRIEIIANSNSGGNTGGGDFCNIDVEKKGGRASHKNGFTTYDQQINGKGSLTFKGGSIPDRYVIYGPNGEVVEDSRYIATEQHQYTGWKYVPMYVAKLSQMQGKFKDKEAFSGVEGQLKSFNTLDDLIDSLKDDSGVYDTGDHTEISYGVSLLKKLWNQGQRQFMFYDNDFGPKEIMVETNGDEYDLVVYSPVGKTGWSIEGSCD